MIGWMQNWDTCSIREPEDPWAGQMSLPRELFLKEGRLCQRPIRELDALRKNEVSYENVRVKGRQVLDGLNGRVQDIELTIMPAPDQPLFHKFTILFAENEDYHTGISFRPVEGTLKVDRKFSGSRRAIIHQRRAKVQDPDNCLKLRIILDRYSVEVFIGDGEQVMSAALYTPLEADGVSFEVSGEAVMTVRKWEL